MEENKNTDTSKQEKHFPKVNEKFIITIAGKDYVTYEGLLDLAHKIGLKSMSVDLIQIPSRENNLVAICRAKAVTHSGEVYIDLGDASPSSVQTHFVPHIIRMASTRAKARALRDLTNVGITALEEISMEESEGPNYSLANQGQINRLKQLIKNTNSDLEIDYKELTQYEAAKLITELQKK